MVQATFVASAAFGVVAGVLYGAVGYLVMQRRAEGDAQVALRLFGVWWYGLSAVSLIGAAQALAVAVGSRDLSLHLALTHLYLVLICLALWALVYYLVFLFTGRTGALVPLAVAYLLYYTFLVYLVQASGPTAVATGRWRVDVEFAREVEGPLVTILLVLLVVPQILGALAYFTLYFKVDRPDQKYRIALVSTSIVVWFGSALAVAVVGASESDAWQVASRLIGIAAASAILAAYRPPAWVRRRHARAAGERGVRAV